ncbi:MAG: malto-oligosyltrehalose trehalohydrolase, partial [Thermoanaerobaculia bacterium]
AERRLPIGAEVVEGGVHFRVWASGQRIASVVVDGRNYALEPDAEGYASRLVPGAGAGSRYGYLFDDDEKIYPDPASRFQPEGPHELSAVVDPTTFEWGDGDWAGVPDAAPVIYELHVGTFTAEGTWSAATRELRRLAELGITIIEVMPVADFPGRFGWGYDGVSLFAPTRLYGAPDDFRRFVDEAHANGIAVILDVVYNHFGPSGNYIRKFVPHFFTDRYENEWGDAIGFDGPLSAPVREFYVANAAYWIEEFHLDGLRLDATQMIFDASPEHIIAAVARRVRDVARGRRTFIVAENEPQDVRLVSDPSRGGYGIDALWNDDWHHAAIVALTGRAEAYYSDYRGTPQELISSARWGFLYQGQWYRWQKQHRGSLALDLPASRFLTGLENHDQVANSVRGDRLAKRVAPAALRAMTTFLLLGPQTPMLFQGQEFGSSRPFVYFADHEPELAEKVAAGRAAFLEQFPSLASAGNDTALPAPHDPAAFEQSKLDRAELESNVEWIALHRDLIRLRQSDPVYAAQRNDLVYGAVFSDSAFLLRWLAGGTDDRLLIVNLGNDLDYSPCPEPLLVPPAGCRWELEFSSESVEYGGGGTPSFAAGREWRIPARTALAFRSISVEVKE